MNFYFLISEKTTVASEISIAVVAVKVGNQSTNLLQVLLQRLYL